MQAENKSKSAKEPGSSSSLCRVCNRWCECETLLSTCVGVIWLMSSDASCFSKVVFPPLSRPSSSILTSWSGVLFSLRRIDSNPCNKTVREISRVMINVTFSRGQGEHCCSWPPLWKCISLLPFTPHLQAVEVRFKDDE